MTFADLRLWATYEEPYINECIKMALEDLVASSSVLPTDDELNVSGKLRQPLHKARKKLDLLWALQSETSTFELPDSKKPWGHPDFRFTMIGMDKEQYDYDVECKLVRIKRMGKRWDYCSHYVTDGILRFKTARYAQHKPAMGTMVGYVQEGTKLALKNLIDGFSLKEGLNSLTLSGTVNSKGVTFFHQKLTRVSDDMTLHHLWVDLT